LGRDARAFATTKIATIGPATAEALYTHLRLRADFTPHEAVAEAILAEWNRSEMEGKRVLLPRAQEAREILPEKLREWGTETDVIPLYQTVFDAESAESLRSQLQNGEIDAITFASSSTVRNFAQAVSPNAPERLAEIVGKTCIAAIGPITAATAREFGIPPQIVAETHTLPGLIAALETYFKEERL
jgi:uroporphyrinogen III methyltransferase/synthase